MMNSKTKSKARTASSLKKAQSSKPTKASIKKAETIAKTPVRARGRERVDKVLTAAIKLLENHELSEVTIMAIADEAKIGRSSIYEYFPTVEAIFRVLAERYAAEVVEECREILIKLNSHSLEKIVDALIDVTVNYFNERPAAAKLHLGSDVSFALKVVVRDFHRAGASCYHEWYKVKWGYEPLGEDDPFRTLSVLQNALLSESVQRHGRITDYFRNQLKLVAHAYLSHFTKDIKQIDPDEPRPHVKNTVTPGYLISLESGRKVKSLAPYLRANYDMSPDEYREKWGLPADYPMAAPRSSK